MIFRPSHTTTTICPTEIPVVHSRLLLAYHLSMNPRKLDEMRQGSHRRSVKIYEIRADAKAEKAAMMFENARKSALAERELNDFIAHEVRNPLSAAMTASVFVSSASSDKKTSLADPKTRKSIQDDMGIIDYIMSYQD
jgi:signal transduction histidine kinase